MELCLRSPIHESLSDDQQLNLKGSLILADPSLRDPNFCRKVLILTEHSHAVGAHGYVLNRPLGKKVGDVLPSEDFPLVATVPIFIGGPVAQEQLTFAALGWDSEAKKVTMETHLSTSTASERLKEGAVVRAFVGYAGWAGGQLEAELQQRAWITCKSSRSVLRKRRLDALWAEILRKMGPYYSLLAATPEDPSLN